MPRLLEGARSGGRLAESSSGRGCPADGTGATLVMLATSGLMGTVFTATAAVAAVQVLLLAACWRRVVVQRACLPEAKQFRAIPATVRRFGWLGWVREQFPRDVLPPLSREDV